MPSDMACSRPSASTSSAGKVFATATQAAPASRAEYSNCAGCALLNEAWLKPCRMANSPGLMRS
ncbi:hypothetical protein D3C72_2211040 [compost metagenome]